MEKRGNVTDPMTRAVNAWEILKTLQSLEIMYRLKMRSLIELVDVDDFEFLDCLFVQIEPSEIPDLIVPLIRQTFKHQNQFVAWDQMRAKAWAMGNSPQWRRAMRGLTPNGCVEFRKFKESGGWGAALNSILGV